jgi:hypothetical protein
MKCVITGRTVAVSNQTMYHHHHHHHPRRMNPYTSSVSSFYFYSMMILLLLLFMILSSSDMIIIHHSFVWGLTSISILPKHHIHTTSAYLNSIPYYKHYQPSITGNWLRSSYLPATMYLPEDWVDDDANQDDRSTTSMTSSSSSSSSSSSLTIPSILKSPEWVAPLARIAAEYTKRLTPTIGHINVQQIEHVSITNVAPSHVDIEAIVCENDACVSLSVPVPFLQPCLTSSTTATTTPLFTTSESQPHPPITQQQQQQQLGDKSFEDCVIRNIQELDTVQLQQQATASTTTTTSTDVDVSHIEYPSWWVNPIPSMEFTRECQSLLQILNEPEFQREITILVTKELYRMLNMEDTNPNHHHHHHHHNTPPPILQVQSAVAVAVGPKGMIFRVQAIYEQLLEIVDVPIPFSSHGLLSIRDENDPLSLRNAVLFTIENVLP